MMILTGGGILPEKYYRHKVSGYKQDGRNEVEELMIQKAVESNTPLLGICREMQQINGYFGGNMSSSEKLIFPRPVRVEYSVVLKEKGITFQVYNYHSDVVYYDDLANELQAIAIDSDNGIVKAFRNRDYKTIGFQWHLERKCSDQCCIDITKKLISSIM